MDRRAQNFLVVQISNIRLCFVPAEMKDETITSKFRCFSLFLLISAQSCMQEFQIFQCSMKRSLPLCTKFGVTVGKIVGQSVAKL